jgi:peptide chain release factor 1
MQKIFKKIRYFEKNYENIIEELVREGTCSNIEKLKKECGQKISFLNKLIDLYHEYEDALKSSRGLQIDLRSSYELYEYKGLKQEEKKAKEAVEKIITLILPSNPEDKRNATIKTAIVKGGKKNDFLEKLVNAYKKYFLKMGWDTKKGKHLNEFEITGKEVYKYLKLENGTHRIKYDKDLLVMVEVRPIKKQKTFGIPDRDVKVEVFHSSGHGGQSVNTTNSGVRMTHIPTGISAESQDQRSQYQNKKSAYKVLNERVFRYYNVSEKDTSKIKPKLIRTYDFKNNLLSDHRLKRSFEKLDVFLKGDMGFISEALIEQHALHVLEKIDYGRSIG